MTVPCYVLEQKCKQHDDYLEILFANESHSDILNHQRTSGISQEGTGQ